MKQGLTELMKTLKALSSLHGRLLDVCRAERIALVAVDLGAIQEVSVQKQQLIAEIQEIEKKRIWIVKNIAEVDLKSPTHVTLLELIQVLEGVRNEESVSISELKLLYQQLTHQVQEIQKCNQYNRDLVERTLNHIQKMKRNVLGEVAPKAETYNTHGQRKPMTGGARLISQEA